MRLPKVAWLGTRGPVIVLGVLLIWSAAASVPASARGVVQCGGMAATRVGTSGDDVITGTEGPDVISGLGGNDTINGLGGDDIICGDEGKDRLDGGDGSDRLIGGGGRDRLLGGPGNDTISGGRDDDVLKGQGGDDVLIGGLGDDRILGGAGPDTVNYVYAPTGVDVDLRRGEAIRGSGTNVELDVIQSVVHIVGSDFDDRLVGTNHANRLAGRDGSDDVIGLGGPDELLGGDGVDWVDYRSASGPVTVNLKNGTAKGQGADTLRSIESGWGSDYGDVLQGNSADNQFIAMDGNDRVRGAGGTDILHGGFGGENDLDGGPGDDALSFINAISGVAVTLADATTTTARGVDNFAGIEFLLGSFYDDVLIGDARDNYMLGRNGDDVLKGKGGDDVLDAGEDPGGGDSDNINGGSGNDTCIGGESVTGCESIGNVPAAALRSGRPADVVRREPPVGHR